MVSGRLKGLLAPLTKRWMQSRSDSGVSQAGPATLFKPLLLFVGQNTIRKGLEDAVTAYSRAFDTVNDTQLVMKCYSLSDKETPINTIISHTARCNMKCKDNPIYTITENLPMEGMVDLPPRPVSTIL